MMKKYRDSKRLRGECLNDARKARPGKLYCEHCAIQSNERQARYRIRRLYPYLETFTRAMIARPLWAGKR
jgi:hypothetical protein